QLTNTGAANRAKWSPDGKTIAFVSSHAGRPQIYSVPAAGGEPMQLSNHGAGIRDFAWSRDGKWIAFISAEPPAPQPPSASDHKIIRVVSGSDVQSRVWLLDVAAKSEKKLTS